MKKRIAAFGVIAVLTIGVAASRAQFSFFTVPVFDVTNYLNALERYFQLQQQLAQLVTTYRQIVLEYEHMVYQARQLPGLVQHRFTATPWGTSHAANTYGTTGGWTAAINSGISAAQGYGQAVEQLAAYGAAFGQIPADQIGRAETGYASVELADAANIHGIQLIGTQRSKAPSTEAAIRTLEAATLSAADDFNTEIAVLNKINATNMMALRAGQDTNQLLVSLLEQTLTESKARRDAEATVINANVAFRLNAFDAGMEGVLGTTDAISSFQMR